MVAFWSAYGHAPGRTLRATPEVVWFYTGVQVPVFNGVLYASLQPAGVKATIDGLQVLIDAQGTPALWWIGPRSRPDDLDRLLERYGLQPVGQVPGMAMDLCAMDQGPSERRDAVRPRSFE